MAERATAELTWIGHSTVLVEAGGVRAITDPVLTRRVAHLRRHHPEPSEVPTPDLVLISHLHMDHLHLPSLRTLGPDVEVVVPSGAAGFLRGKGFGNVSETRIGATRTIGELTIETVPANHSGSRGPHSRVEVEPVGYVLRSDGGSVYFPGDTDLFPEMADLVDIDVALLPIGGWGPSVGEGHLDPTRATEAAGIIDSRLVVPIHHGTYTPVALRRGTPRWIHDSLHAFRDEMEQAGLADRVRALVPGEALPLP